MAGEFVVPSDGSEGLQQEVNLEKPPAEPVTLTTQMALEHVAVLKKILQTVGSEFCNGNWRQ